MYLILFVRCIMDRESKKLVCPVCSSEHLQVYTEINKSKKLSVFWIVLSALSGFIIVCSLIIAFSTPSYPLVNNTFDYSKINTAVFWIINITIPLIVFMTSIATTIILYNLPKAENKLFCCNCKSMSIKSLNIAIYKNNNE